MTPPPPPPHTTRITFNYKNSDRRIQNPLECETQSFLRKAVNNFAKIWVSGWGLNKPLKWIHENLPAFMRLNIALYLDKTTDLQVCFTNSTWTLFVFPIFDFPLEVFDLIYILNITGITFQIFQLLLRKYCSLWVEINHAEFVVLLSLMF